MAGTWATVVLPGLPGADPARPADQPSPPGPAQPPVHRRRPLPLWLAWVGANTAGFLLAGMLVLAIATARAATGAPPDTIVVEGWEDYLAAGAMLLLWVWIALAQWAVLRRHLRHATAWLVVTAVAGNVGSVLGGIVGAGAAVLAGFSMEGPAEASATASQPLGYLLLCAGTAVGLACALGVGQWRVLRREVPRARGWLPAAALGAWWLALTWPVVAGTEPVGVALLRAGVSGAGYGAITGWALARLLGRQRRGTARAE